MFQQLLERLRIRQPESLPETSVFFLQTDDSVTSICDRLDWAKTERVVLVIPPDASVLSERLDLLRIQRHATQRQIGVALVTEEPARHAVAHEIGVPVFWTVGRAEQGRWRQRSVASSPSPRKGRPQLAELRPRDSRMSGYILFGMTAGVALVLAYDLLTLDQIDFALLRKDLLFGVIGGAAAGLLAYLFAWLLDRFLPQPYRWMRWALMTLVFAIGILAPIGAVYIIVPGARLTMIPAGAPASAVVRITVVVPAPGQDQDGGLKEIDFDGHRIAGRRVSAEVGAMAVSGATGTSEVPSSRAMGTVVFSNLLSQDYTIGKNTLVRTSAGAPVRFATTGDVTVPPSGQAAVGIEAVEPGPQGNVGVGLVNRVEGAAARAVRVTNPEPTRGGGVTQVRAVTQDDRDALRRTLLTELRAQGYERVLERPPSEGGLREGEYLVPGSVQLFQVLHETFDRFATEEAESVKLEMRVLVTGVVVDLGDAYNLARRVLDGRVPEGYELKDVQYQPGLMGDNVIGEGTLTFFVEAEGLAEATLQPDQVRHWLRGKPSEEGLALLSSAWKTNELPVKDFPEVEIWPDWATSRFPWLLWRIDVVEVADE